ncbi:MAG: nuclease domain-containing protein [Gemmatimonadota bacterium]
MDDSLRPDYSLRISVSDAGSPRPPKVLWIFFDAKYRIDSIKEVFSAGDDAEESEGVVVADAQAVTGRAVRSDLLKMHAYRDAIRRSAGAYVLYPGTEDAEVFRAYHELLPGLGAFALRPTEDGSAQGGDIVRAFIDDVLDHAASQLSQHERASYWEGVSYARDNTVAAPRDALPILSRPPADTPVLLGYVKSAAHLEWILSAGLYNMRADGRTGSIGLTGPELGVELVVLYGSPLAESRLLTVSGPAAVMTQDQLRATGYPNPQGKLYFCLPVARPQALVAPLPGAGIRQVVRRVGEAKAVGAPLVVSWKDLLE